MKGIIEGALVPLVIVTGGTCESMFSHPIEWGALFAVTIIAIVVVAAWNN